MDWMLRAGSHAEMSAQKDIGVLLAKSFRGLAANLSVGSGNKYF